MHDQSRASRTDSGVHAFGQVATFITDLSLNLDEILKSWNNALPLDIKILSIQQVSDLYSPLKNSLQA